MDTSELFDYNKSNRIRNRLQRMTPFRMAKKKPTDVQSFKGIGINLLHHAIASRKFKAVKILTEGGADVNGVTANGSRETPLMTVCSTWNTFDKADLLKILRYLMQHGADPFIRNALGENCYEFANKLGAEILSIEIRICYQERKYSNSNQVYTTGNIMSELKTPSPITKKCRLGSGKSLNEDSKQIRCSSLLTWVKKESVRKIGKVHNDMYKD